ncbi:hypothetical protein GCK32_005187, partial [Trichostrongylus colubriformis]
QNVFSSFFYFPFQILEYVSSEFPMYDADLGKNQTFYEFCHGFCQANEPVRMVYNILRILEGNVSEGIRQRVNLSYPTSEIFSTKFSLLPSFFGVEMEENGTSIKSVKLINLLFRAERHPSWTVDMVKEWEMNIEEYFSRYEHYHCCFHIWWMAADKFPSTTIKVVYL